MSTQGGRSSVGTLRLLLVGLVVLCLYLYGSQEPRASKLRYQQDIQLAADDLKVVTAATTDAAISSPLQTLSEDGEIYASQGLHATQHGSAPAQTVAQADIGALQARGDQAIRADEATFTASAPAGRDDFTIAEFAVIALALLMAAGCARGIDQRLADYR
jgi:hypothetical protein